MKRIFIIISMMFFIGCGQTAPELDGKIITVEGKTYSISTAGGKLYYIEEVQLVNKPEK